MMGRMIPCNDATDSNLPILGIGSFLHRPATSRVGFVYTNMEGKTRFHCKINLSAEC